MKIIRFSLFLMLILTLTPTVTSCDLSDLIEASIPQEIESQLDIVENRIENEPHTPQSYIPAEPLNRTETAEQTDGTRRKDGKADKDFVGEVVLTVADAERIALEHASVAAADALYLRTESERDDGIPVYEVEFAISLSDATGYMEYEYTIHADTGEILEFESDFEVRR